MKRNRNEINKIFKAKKKRRQELAKMPIEEKIRILVQLQKIAIPIFMARGIKKRLWSL